MQTTYTLKNCWKEARGMCRWSEFKLILMATARNITTTVRALWPVLLGLSVVGVFLSSFVHTMEDFAPAVTRYQALVATCGVLYTMIYVLYARPSMQRKGWQYLSIYMQHLFRLAPVFALVSVFNAMLIKFVLPIPMAVIFWLTSFVINGGLQFGIYFYLDDVPTFCSLLRALKNGLKMFVYFAPLYLYACLAFLVICLGIGVIVGLAATLIMTILVLTGALVGPAILYFMCFIHPVFIITILYSAIVVLYTKIKHTHYTLFFLPKAKSIQS